MKWEKKGLVYGPRNERSWARHSALTPTPIRLDADVIRVYAGFRDEAGVSRIGFVDVAAREPTRVLRVSAAPVLDIGSPGAFDDNGIILGDVVRHEERLFMFYVGFQHVARAKFLAFSGLAISSDNGATFERFSAAPVMDRADEGLYIRAVHSVCVENGTWRVWYAAGNGWETIAGKPYPQYHIRYLEARAAGPLPASGARCVDVQVPEYRIGRPRVYRFRERYMMFYTRGTTTGEYLAGYAESSDGLHWVRKDDQLGMALSAEGWDSRHLCYPALIECEGRVFMFYNGNDMGREGFGCAELRAW